MNVKQLVLTGAMMTAMGLTPVASAVTALSVAMDFKGYVTMVVAGTGIAFQNGSFVNEPRFNGWRSPIEGRMVMNVTESGLVGGATFEPFPFYDVQASGRDVTFVPADSLFGTPIPSNTLLVGNMAFDWGETKGIPVSIVLDMGNLSTALMSASVGDVITGALRAATDNTVITLQDGTMTTMPIGPVVVATTTWDTTDVDTDGDGQPGPITMSTNPSGTVPLLVDTVLDRTNGDIGIGGSPIKTSFFQGFSPNFDITEVTVTCVSALVSCETSGISVPSLPLSPQPLEPVQDGLGGLLKKFGL